MPTRDVTMPHPVDTVTRDAPRSERQGREGKESAHEWDPVGRCGGVDVPVYSWFAGPYYHVSRPGRVTWHDEESSDF